MVDVVQSLTISLLFKTSAMNIVSQEYIDRETVGLDTTDVSRKLEVLKNEVLFLTDYIKELTEPCKQTNPYCETKV